MIWDHLRAGNFAGNPKLNTKPSQNHPKLRKLENQEKHPKTTGNDEFLMLKIHFRFADAANHLNARPRGPRVIRVTRRAYLAQLLRVIRWQGAASLKIKIKRQLE